MKVPLNEYIQLKLQLIRCPLLKNVSSCCGVQRRGIHRCSAHPRKLVQLRPCVNTVYPALFVILMFLETKSPVQCCVSLPYLFQIKYCVHFTFFHLNILRISLFASYAHIQLIISKPTSYGQYFGCVFQYHSNKTLKTNLFPPQDSRSFFSHSNLLPAFCSFQFFEIFVCFSLILCQYDFRCVYITTY